MLKDQVNPKEKGLQMSENDKQSDVDYWNDWLLKRIAQTTALVVLATLPLMIYGVNLAVRFIIVAILVLLYVRLFAAYRSHTGKHRWER